MITEMIHGYLSDRAARGAPVTAAVDGMTPAPLKRQRRFRRILALVLLFIGAVSFVEVVLLPGKMVRDRLASASDSNSDDDDAMTGPTLSPWFLSEGERRDRAEVMHRRRVLASLGKLQIACSNLERAFASFTSYADRQLDLPRTDDQSHMVPQTLTDVIASEPTAPEALATILSLREDVADQLTKAHARISRCEENLKSDAALDENERILNVEAAELESACFSLQRGKRYIEHLSTLKRGTDALARLSNPQPSSQGAPQ